MAPPDGEKPAADKMHALRASMQNAAIAPLLWPATLHHLALGSPDPEALAGFYADHLDFSVVARNGGEFFLAGPQRRLVIGPGAVRQLLYAAFDLGESSRVARYRAALERGGLMTDIFSSSFLAQGAFAVVDPDGNRMVFGAARADAAATGRPGRLQHFALASPDAARMAAFYAGKLGMRVTDWVRDGEGAITAAFLRSDEEHHSLAVFRAPAARLDHFSCELPDWDSVRDWSDAFSRAEVPIFWGPGRHGPGNNLFVMANDPDGNAMEFSAEITRHPFAMPPGEWPHLPRTLNLWGAAIMRS